MPGYLEVTVVSRTHHLEGALVSLLLVVRPQPRRPTRARDRQVVQDRQVEVPRVGQRMDEKVRHARFPSWFSICFYFAICDFKHLLLEFLI